MTPSTEFSHIVTIEPWPAEGIAIELAASDVECQRLKERFDLVDLTSLRASGRIDKAGDELVFGATLEAEVAQACVVTLKPVPSLVKTSFERRFRRGDDESSIKGRGEILLEEDEADIEVLEQDQIDVGEVIAEELYLALDPYPRAGDADLVMAEVRETFGQDVDEVPDNPFAQLRRH